jgi:hypothetical protein
VLRHGLEIVLAVEYCVSTGLGSQLYREPGKRDDPLSLAVLAWAVLASSVWAVPVESQTDVYWRMYMYIHERHGTST